MAFDFPNSPATGTIATGPNNAQWRFDGTKWTANSQWTGSTVFVGDTPPSNPAAGTLWWCSADGNLYCYYQDPNSPEWVIANTGGIAEAPTDGNMYARQSQAWTNVSAVTAAAPNNTGRSLIHNGTFTVWQRGTGTWNTSTYTADRWMLGLSGTAPACLQNVLNDTDRSQIGDESARYALRATFTGAVAATDYSIQMHRIENIRRLSNKTVTLSFWARGEQAGLKLGASFDVYYGSGGTPSATANLNGQSVSLTTSWARYSLTFTLPTTSGLTLGTNGDDYTQLDIWYTAGSSFAARAGGVGSQSGGIQLWGVQLEYGSVATSLAKRDPADELALCQRFYQTGTEFWHGYQGAGSNCGTSKLLPVQMRATPTFAFNTPSTSNCGTPALYTGTNIQFEVYAVATATGSVGFSTNWTASADL